MVGIQNARNWNKLDVVADDESALLIEYLCNALWQKFIVLLFASFCFPNRVHLVNVNLNADANAKRKCKMSLSNHTDDEPKLDQIDLGIYFLLVYRSGWYSIFGAKDTVKYRKIRAKFRHAT